MNQQLAQIPNKASQELCSNDPTAPEDSCGCCVWCLGLAALGPQRGGRWTHQWGTAAARFLGYVQLRHWLKSLAC